jgi:phthiocerol/phenolphthiocerol synthesis type-I polyketide synthase C
VKVHFQDRTLVDHVCTWAELRPDEPSLIYLNDGEHAQTPVTFQQLRLRAESVAARLLEVASPGDRAILLFAPGNEYAVAFLGCLYARIIAVPAYPPDIRRLDESASRLTALVADAEPTVILTDRQVRPAVALIDFPSSAPAVLTAEVNEEADPLPFGHQLPGPADIAFVQYTSGSTSEPRGVIMTHEKVMRQIDLIVAPYHYMIKPGEVGCSWLPPYHDMGLIGMILCAFRCGNPLVLMSPLDFLKRPYRWVKAMSDYRARITAAPNFAFELCRRKVTEDELLTLDLSAWEVAINGAEPIDAATLAEFTDYFGRAGLPKSTLRPAYGLAEAGLMVTIDTYAGATSSLALEKSALERGKVVLMSHDGGGATVEIVSEGRPVADLTVQIVDPETAAPVAEDTVGEIWVAGSSLGDGYWGREAETSATFGAHLDGDVRPYLRTGDLGFLHEQRLYVTGRLKDVLIVKGRNIYPHDVESVVYRVDSRLRPGCGVAVAGPADNDGIMIVQEVKEATAEECEALMAEMRRVLFSRFQLTPEIIACVRPHSVPKTSSGKLQRRRARQAYLEGKMETVSVWTAPAMRQGAVR